MTTIIDVYQVMDDRGRWHDAHLVEYINVMLLGGHVQVVEMEVIILPAQTYH